MLVLVRGQVAARVPEAAAQRDVHRGLLRGPVEGLGHRRTPVDHHRVAVVVVHMPPPDVEALALGALGLVRARCVQVVEPAEEQRGVAEVGEGLDPLVDLTGEDFGVDPVRGDVADVEGLDVLAHGAQGGTGGGEMGALPGEGIVGRRRGQGVPPLDPDKSGDSRPPMEPAANGFCRPLGDGPLRPKGHG